MKLSCVLFISILLILPARVWAQSLSELTAAIAEKNLAEGTASISGINFIPFLESPYTDCSIVCCTAQALPSTQAQASNPTSDKKTYTEVVAIIEGASPVQVAMNALNIQKFESNASGIAVQPVNFSGSMQQVGVTKISSLDQLNSITNQLYFTGMYDGYYNKGGTQVALPGSSAPVSNPSAPPDFSKLPPEIATEAKLYYQDIQTKAIIYYASQMQGATENQISQTIATYIQQQSTSDQDKFEFLSRISDAFYQQYNNARNPGKNNAQNNPGKAPLPSGDIPLIQMLQTSANPTQGNAFNGGVCNDISEAVAKISAKVFPDKDVLTITGGSHFGVMIADGKNTEVIDGYTRYQVKNQISLLPDAAVTNVRVSKMVDGKLKEIGVVDTQLGQLVNHAFGNELPDLKSGANLDDVLLQAKKVWDNGDGVKKQLFTSLADAQLGNGNTTLITAKYEIDTKNTHAYLGLGAGTGKFGGDPIESYQVYLRAGIDRAMLKYISPKAKVIYSTGVHLDNEETFSRDGWNSLGLAGGLSLKNQVNADLQLGKTGIQSNTQVINSLGPSSWGQTTGAVSTENFHNAMKMLSYMDFHLNQVNSTLNANTPLSTNTTALTSAHYQGSALGQTLEVTGGVRVIANNKAQISMYIGKKSVTHGYQTKYDELGDVPGMEAGAEYDKNGKSFEIQSEGLGTGNSRVNGTAIIPLKWNKKGE